MRIKSLNLKLIVGFFVWTQLFVSCKHQAIEEISPTNAKPISHQNWNKLLKQHVSEDGIVSYSGFRKESNTLEDYLKLLSSAHPHSSWTKNERKAYWINLYNAFTIKLILDHYPVKSIKDIGGTLQSPWNIKLIEIEGKKYHLNDIEHNILRPKFNDPRIHFAVNCASYSCPKLLNQAIVPERIEEQLESLGKSFVNDPKRNKITADKIQISEIFKWFQKDFTKKGSLIDFLNRYANTKINAKAKIEYLDYNWSLNE